MATILSRKPGGSGGGGGAPSGPAGGSLSGTYPNPGIADGAVTAAKVDSGAVTAGQVLTSDGGGGAAWEASGGGVSMLWFIVWDSLVYGASPSYPASWTLTDQSGAGKNQLWANTIEQTAPAQNDYIEWPVDLSAGTWKFSLLGVKFTNGGIITLSLDGTDVGTIDQYAAGATYNQEQEITGITVATSGRKLMRLTAKTKNGSSTGYAMRMTRIRMLRTGA